jgi:3-hydroxybutyryl-CoA dehydrogenase
MNDEAVSQMKVAVVGFGMMGRQISQVFAQYGNQVAATDENKQALTIGLDEIANGPYGVKSAIAKGKMTTEEGSRTLSAIRTSPSIEDACKNADLVIEAVFENLSLKQRVLAQLDSIAPRKVVLASNTSTLGISKIASKLAHKDRVLGMHFFNPAQVTKLVEIVKAEETSSSSVQEASRIVESIGKTPIIARDEPGFVANRLGLTLYVEASRLFEEGGATPRDIDIAMKLGYNHPMGPFEVADLVGLDTRLRNLEALFNQTGDEKWIPPKILREMVNQGYVGNPSRKAESKGGYYEYLNLKR